MVILLGLTLFGALIKTNMVKFNNIVQCIGFHPKATDNIPTGLQTPIRSLIKQPQCWSHPGQTGISSGGTGPGPGCKTVVHRTGQCVV